MQEVRVWAPRADRVDVVVEDVALALRCDPHAWGWWEGVTLGDAQNYKIRLDGGEAFPDPRSRFQPYGVHGASRACAIGSREPARFVPTPLERAVIYELHLGTFTPEGTFASAIEHLNDLTALGVTHIELMPVAQFPGAHGWGYDGVNLFAPQASYGGPSGLRQLVRACHERGLAVILDVVHNHLGPEGNYLDRFGPFHTETHRTPWGAGINFDAAQSHEVRRFFIDSALAWLRDYDIDGLRLDAVHAIVDSSKLHFVAELADAVRDFGTRLGRTLQVIGEYDNHDPIVVAAREEGGYGLDAHWNDDFHHALHVLLTREDHGYLVDFAAPQTLVDVLHHGYFLDGRHSAFRGGPHGKPFGRQSRARLVAYTQSHDQVGNRAGGERLVHLAGDARAKIAAAILFSSPFVPMLFQGEEWGASSPFLFFADYGEPALREAVRAGRHREHGALDVADPMEPETRERCVLRWDERGHDSHAAMLSWYRDVIAARREYVVLRDAGPEATRAEWRQHLLLIHRGDLTIAANFGNAPQSLALGDVLLASNPLVASDQVPAFGCVVMRGRLGRRERLS
jgi:maltooligosyltrehalose trehalohydrolase